ncbi:oleandomycin transport system permease protein [Actinomadura meyerae]|jgi:oleandomycin transport system permease protein|uniref:Transport permease protein n=1 Tax=Actinomadura meyerae TaxID=240840 RepID=A0A239NAU6_9ACTN|nr:ABC transporter permease [Actinomadura meyerae]SNT52107.1 oleandomycin transport system permease protein [Actinomadura meyerae]
MSETTSAVERTAAEEEHVRREAPPHRRYAVLWHSLALARRNLIKIKRNPISISDAVIAPVTFLLIFVYMFGGAVSGSTHAYLQRTLPAILVLSAIMAGMIATGVNLSLDIKKGIFDRFRSLPISRSAPLIGSVLADVVRYLVSIVTLLAFGYLIGFRIETDPLRALGAALLTIVFGMSLSWLWILLGMVIKETASVQTIVALSIFPLAFGTDMVAPTETLPGWLQAWAKVNPVGHTMEACRGLLIGGDVAEPLTKSLLWSAGLVVVFAPLAVLAYRRRT